MIWVLSHRQRKETGRGVEAAKKSNDGGYIQRIWWFRRSDEREREANGRNLHRGGSGGGLNSGQRGAITIIITRKGGVASRGGELGRGGGAEEIHPSGVHRDSGLGGFF
ncbi:hypothetical protein F2Q70_00007646 [Brassica cretica]|uniref:Uncharacterized protein n=1 Tax=Brassica cretica TaxID=69181 RepID=A0A3N6RPY5_BRACR|nr:hypothetical protein F2Q70_00007646 [Brassica cretica]KAF3533468.1 hypothetical protein DY000_02043812 [Brassica cretica]